MLHFVTEASANVYSADNHCEDVESPSQPSRFQRSFSDGSGNNRHSNKLGFKVRSYISHGSSKLLKKRVPISVDGISDVITQYFEMGNLLGYDMDGNKEQVCQIFSSIGVIQVDQ